jgi:hypothetical protein
MKYLFKNEIKKPKNKNIELIEKLKYELGLFEKSLSKNKFSWWPTKLINFSGDCIGYIWLERYVSISPHVANIDMELNTDTNFNTSILASDQTSKENCKNWNGINLEYRELFLKPSYLFDDNYMVKYYHIQPVEFKMTCAEYKRIMYNNPISKVQRNGNIITNCRVLNDTHNETKYYDVGISDNLTLFRIISRLKDNIKELESD